MQDLVVNENNSYYEQLKCSLILNNSNIVLKKRLLHLFFENRMKIMSLLDTSENGSHV